MKKMTPEEYYNLINTSTYISNLNQGNVIDPFRYLLTQKMETFKKLKPQDDSNFIGDQTRAQSNYGRIK
tara:strand:- start:426 stop:632 length:207 start_codon:yes stop_codon:yes gene_type:complete